MSFIRVVKDEMAQVIQKNVLHSGYEGQNNASEAEKCPSFGL
ncbi:hypothetical protein JOC74_001607 [Bacillus capparidis]|uniref:Uncharacterized protein n=1 Tax=Bacillus capparidis TaxID=1840411 RepID=A0ABS4CU47_9BACI|nr:hypothetical protein [Bacillus capparidis]